MSKLSEGNRRRFQVLLQLRRPTRLRRTCARSRSRAASPALDALQPGQENRRSLCRTCRLFRSGSDHRAGGLVAGDFLRRNGLPSVHSSVDCVAVGTNNFASKRAGNYRAGLTGANTTLCCSSPPDVFCHLRQRPDDPRKLCQRRSSRAQNTLRPTLMGTRSPSRP
jgi:hypothetical protein